MRCPICRKRRLAMADDVCRTCRRFIADYIDTGLIRQSSMPMVADVYAVMCQLGVSQDRAVIALGGTP